MQVFCQVIGGRCRKNGSWYPRDSRGSGPADNPGGRPCQKSTADARPGSARFVQKRTSLGWALMWVWLFGGAVASTPSGAQAAEISEPGSGQKFTSPLTFLGKQHTLVGTGLRKRDNGNVYSMGLYVEDAARQSFNAVYDRANRTRAGLFAENRAHNYFIWGHFAKLAVLRALRGITQTELQQMFSEPLSELLTEKSPPEVRQDTLALLALLDSDLREGQELRLYTDDRGQIDVYLDGRKKAGPQNPKLARHLWEIWLGFRPVQASMRQTLLERLDVLALIPNTPLRPSAAAVGKADAKADAKDGAAGKADGKPAATAKPAPKAAKFPPYRAQ